MTHGKHWFELNQSGLPNGAVFQQLLAVYLEVATNVLLLLRTQVFIQALGHLLADCEGADPVHLDQIWRIPEMEEVTVCEAPLVVVRFELILVHELIFEG